MKKLFNLKKMAIFTAVVAMTAGLLLPRLASAEGTAVFVGGNFMTAVNNTTRNADWSDPVSATPGQVIEFRIVAQNSVPDATAKNVMVKADLQSQRATTVVATGRVSADNAAAVTDTATVNVTGGEKQALTYFPGHVRIFSKSCPNGCAGSDDVVKGGVKVDDLAWGESAQVLFKAHVSNWTPEATPAPTATPTVAPTATPTATPTVAPTAVPTATAPAGGNVQCPAGTIFSRIEGNNIICINNVNNNNNTNNNNQTITITIPTGSPTVLAAATTNVKELPNTGLPLAGLALAGLTPVGMKLRKSGKLSNLSPNFIWEKREFDKES